MREGKPHTTAPERAELAATAPRSELEPLFMERVKEILVALARNPNLEEQDLLRLLGRKDMPQEALRELARHPQAARSYQVKLAMVRHPKTPRLISLSLLKFLYLFDLVGVSRTPGAPAEVKKLAEEMVLTKMHALPRGEKITLACRASGRVAAGLLVTEDSELIRAALSNPFLTEARLLKVLALSSLPSLLVESISQHEKWSRAYHLRLALIRHPLTPFARVVEFLPDVAAGDLRDICQDSRMPDRVREYIVNHCARGG